MKIVIPASTLVSSMQSPLYLARGQRGGVLVRRWNLIVPEVLVEGRDPDES